MLKLQRGFKKNILVTKYKNISVILFKLMQVKATIFLPIIICFDNLTLNKFVLSIKYNNLILILFKIIINIYHYYDTLLNLIFSMRGKVRSTSHQYTHKPTKIIHNFMKTLKLELIILQAVLIDECVSTNIVQPKSLFL